MPGRFDVSFAGLGAADTDTQDASSRYRRGGDEHLALLVQLLSYLVGGIVAVDVCHADQIDGAFVSELPVRIGLDLLFEPY